ncbi:ornithine cyclodeaminase family protein [Micromonospora sp. KC721]|nr:ornithine cyclodeaminase family protein [Micromonospora sp. KC721]
MTLLLSRSDLEKLLDVDACTEALEQGFRSGSSPFAPQRVRTDLPGPGTATALIPGLVEGVPAYTVKINAKFPGSQPALRGVVCLHDLGTGELLAVMDSTTVTAWRTGLSAALGTHVLARPGASRITVVGAGAQADLVMRGLAALRSWNDLVVCDLHRERAEDFAKRHGGIATTEDRDPRTAARDADIVVLATWSRAPLLDDGDLMPGAHVTSLGADEPGKAELSAELLTAGRVIVDDVSLAVAMGALGTAELTTTDTAGTLSQVLRGTVPGRRSDTDVTIYTPVGLPWQDLVLAWMAYQRALATNIGSRFDFVS